MGIIGAMIMVVLREQQTAGDSRFLSAKLNDSGDLVFEGQDMGTGVQEVLGCSEYEWAWTVKASDITLFNQALDVKGEILQVLAEHFKGDKAADLHGFMTEHQIPFESWGRTGD